MSILKIERQFLSASSWTSVPDKSGNYKDLGSGSAAFSCNQPEPEGGPFEFGLRDGGEHGDRVNGEGGLVELLLKTGAGEICADRQEQIRVDLTEKGARYIMAILLNGDPFCTLTTE